MGSPLFHAEYFFPKKKWKEKKIYNSDKKHFYFFLLFFRKEKINKYKKIKYFWKENRNLLYHIFLDLSRKRINGE